jgi:DNA end-binding protein Ku
MVMGPIDSQGANCSPAQPPLVRGRSRPQILVVAKERAIWTGALSFGLVNIPVRLYSATVSHDIAFHQFEEKTGQRIHNKRVAERSGREVPYQKIVKGYEVSKGKVVMIEPKELEALEPKKTRTIDLELFVDMHEIDPIYWDRTYYLGPDDSPGAAKSYELLRRAMSDTERVGVGRFVMRTKEYLATIRPLGQGLALETMFFPDEIRDQREVLGPLKKVNVSPRELEMAKQLIKSLEDKWDPHQLKDTYRDRVLDLIRKKAHGEEIVAETAPEPKGEVIDLMEALKASLGATTNGRSARRAKPRAASAKNKTHHRRSA